MKISEIRYTVNIDLQTECNNNQGCSTEGRRSWATPKQRCIQRLSVYGPPVRALIQATPLAPNINSLDSSLTTIKIFMSQHVK